MASPEVRKLNSVTREEAVAGTASVEVAAGADQEMAPSSVSGCWCRISESGR